MLRLFVQAWLVPFSSWGPKKRQSIDLAFEKLCFHFLPSFPLSVRIKE